MTSLLLIIICIVLGFNTQTHKVSVDDGGDDNDDDGGGGGGGGGDDDDDDDDDDDKCDNLYSAIT